MNAYATPRATPPSRAKPLKPLQRPCIATVHGNRRLCIPRSAFVSLAARSGAAITGGATVYVRQDSTNLQVHLTPTAGTAPYTLVAGRCRLLLASRSGTPFKPDQRYEVTVTDKGLTLDLTAPL